MHNPLNRILSFSLVLLFGTIISMEFSHAFDHHEDHCLHEGQVHLHEFEPDCSLCYLNFYKTPGLVSEFYNITPETDSRELTERKPGVLNHFRRVIRSPRAPPVC